MHPSSHTSILFALFLFSTLATFSSCHAATPTEPPAHITATRDHKPISKSHSTPVPSNPTFTPTPLITPPPTATVVGASPRPLLSGPIEMHVQPIEVQPPKGELHVTASGVPEKITLASDVKSVPFDLHWPKEPIQFSAVPVEMKWPSQPLRVSIDLNNNGAREERGLRGCDCKQKSANGKGPLISNPVSLTPKESSSSTNSHEGGSATWWAFALLLIEPIIAGAVGGFAIAVVQSINKRREKFDELAKIQAAYEELRRERPSSTDQDITRFEEEKQRKLSNYDEQKRELLESLFKKYRSGDWYEKRVPTEADTTFRDLMPPRSERFPAMLLGIIAAMMLPGLLLFLPEGQLKVDPFSIVRFWSLCLIAAMLGEPFIAFVLKKAREKMKSD